MADDYRALLGDGGQQRKLTWQEASEARAKYASGLYSQSELAALYGVSSRTIWDMLNGKSYLVESPTQASNSKDPDPGCIELPPQQSSETVYEYVQRINAPLAERDARIDARSELLMPEWQAAYARAVASARARWEARELGRAA